VLSALGRPDHNEPHNIKSIKQKNNPKIKKVKTQLKEVDVSALDFGGIVVVGSSSLTTGGCFPDWCIRSIFVAVVEPRTVVLLFLLSL
jgi:hypothetical protein